MTKLREHIEGIRRRLTEIAAGELELVRALADALKRVDQQLLADVRHVAAEHEARRGVILGELQSLAVRIGSFPASHEAAEALGADNGSGAQPGPAHQAMLSGGDWRQAAKNIDDDLDFLDGEFEVNGHAGPHDLSAEREIRYGRRVA